MGKLEQGLKELGISPSGEAYDKLVSYVEELERWNPLYSLVNASGDDLIIRHILDSLSGLSSIQALGGNNNSPRLADMGTGGGLPGIPLSLYLEGWDIHLVERSGKRVNFLNDMILTLGLCDVTAHQKDLKAVRDRFDVITFRAFRPFIPEIIKGLKSCLAPGGVIAAYKGKLSSIEEEEELLRDHFTRIEILPLSVPFLKEERHLLVLGEPV